LYNDETLQERAWLETEKRGLKNLIFDLQINFETTQRPKRGGLQMLGSNSKFEIEK